MGRSCIFSLGPGPRSLGVKTLKDVICNFYFLFIVPYRINQLAILYRKFKFWCFFLLRDRRITWLNESVLWRCLLFFCWYGSMFLCSTYSLLSHKPACLSAEACLTSFSASSAVWDNGIGLLYKILVRVVVLLCIKLKRLKWNFLSKLTLVYNICYLLMLLLKTILHFI